MGLLITKRRDSFITFFMSPAVLAGQISELRQKIDSDQRLSTLGITTDHVLSLEEYIEMLHTQAKVTDAIILADDGNVYNGNGRWLTYVEDHSSEHLEEIAERYEAIKV